MQRTTLQLTTIATVILSAVAQTPTPGPALSESGERVMRVFLKLPVRQQVRALQAVRAAVAEVDTPYLKSLREVAAGAPKLRRKGKLKTRTKKGKDQHSGAGGYAHTLPFPLTDEYLFGFHGSMQVVQPGSKARREATLRAASMRAMLAGYAPETGDALTVLLGRLDHDRGADRLAQLFETWRNGKESFYHALDRTAGSKSSLFYYDAMLDDYVKRCVDKSHPDYREIRKGLEAAHDALHKSFLTYRQYRGFREAMALAMVLPAAEKLPPSLARYDEARGGLSARERVLTLLRAHGQDLGLVVEAFTKTAPALPDGLWKGGYDAFAGLDALVERRPNPGRSWEADAKAQAQVREESQLAVARAAEMEMRKLLGPKSE